jgi:triacylglycerol lipase
MNVIATLMLLAFAQRATAESEASQRECVVLLHGLGRTPLSMKRLEWSLERGNFRVINFAYPSTRRSIEESAARLEVALAPVRREAVRIHFVTHSLGGLIVRQYLSGHRMNNLGRVVMLAPPNQGSELADRLRKNPIYRWITGPSGQQVGTDVDALPKRLGPADFELGIIAGDRSLNPVFSSWIPGLDDGKVSVDSARLEGSRDFRVVHCSHTWMAWSGGVVSAVGRFLQCGQFAPPTP